MSVSAQAEIVRVGVRGGWQSANCNAEASV